MDIIRGLMSAILDMPKSVTLGSAACYKNIVAGQISVDNFLECMEVSQGQGYILGQVDLHVEGKEACLWFEELCQTLVHQFHQEDWASAVGIVGVAEA